MAEADGPGLLQTMCLEIFEEWNPAVSDRRERLDSRTCCLHRQNTAESHKIPGNDGGRLQKVLAEGPVFTQPQMLSRRLCGPSTHSGWVGESDGSLQCGVDSSTEAPSAMCSQACCRQSKLKGAEGASQWGKIVMVFPQRRQIPRRTRMLSWLASWACGAAVHDR